MTATVEASSTASMEEMERFLAAYGPEGATQWHSASTPDKVAALLATQNRSLLNRKDTVKLASHSDFGLRGIACWTPLAWDTEQFGFPAARLDLLAASGESESATVIKTNLVKRAVEDWRERGIRHVTARVAAADTTSIEALQHNSFALIDGIQTFSLLMPPAPHFQKRENPFTLRLFRESDLPQVLEIARTSYVHDRFHADSALDKDTADRINETWVRNSCLGQMADAVIVASAGDTLLGYVTCRIDKEATSVLGVGCGEIGMVATTANSRNAGVASAATISALEWFAMQGVPFVEVGTQFRNIAAARLYERCGFRLAAASLTWRKLV